MDGLWTVEFGSNLGKYGGGVMVIQDGKLLGGDDGYYYIGSYEMLENNEFTARLHVMPFMRDHVSVFDTLHKDFTLNLKGTLTDADHATARGNPEEMPQMDLGIVLTRRENLAA